MKSAILVLSAALILPGCSSTMTYERTMTSEEYATLVYGKNNFIGHTTEDVVRAYGERHLDEPDGLGGRVWTYTSASTATPRVHSVPDAGIVIGGRSVTVPGVGEVTLPPTHVASIPPLVGEGSPLEASPGTTIAVRAKFWFGPDGRVYRYSLPDKQYGR